MKMFCFQCEQTAKGEGCTVKGICGKTPEAANLQDLIIHNLKAIGVLGKKLLESGKRHKEMDRFFLKGLFTTITNVNFDINRLAEIVRKAYKLKEQLKQEVGDTSGMPEIVNFVLEDNIDAMLKQGESIGVMAYEASEDVRSLKELLTYGMKGMAAYADHAYILGFEDDEIYDFFYKGFDAIANPDTAVDDLVNLNMEFGKVNLKCLQLLDKANTETYGNPQPTKVYTGIKKGPAIIVSGHDLKDLKELLEQTKDKGINIYTHGEMLPTHGYPEINKYDHLIGNFGGAWQDQTKEFDSIPATILMTTNCIQKPRESYKDRIYTTGLVAWEGVEHIPEAEGNQPKDFSSVIEKALELGGFPEDKEGKEIMVGFGHNAVMSVADKVVQAVKDGNIKHFFLIGGCDGAKTGRNYYTEVAEKAPDNTVILTLACGKYRFNKKDFGDIGGIPRLLDAGQCNDAYSAIVIASKLAEVFGTDVNGLPLTLILSWYEQKAVCILLTLLSLGIKNIKLGPTLPAFVSKNVLNVLVEKFNIQPISEPEKDIAEALS